MADRNIRDLIDKELAATIFTLLAIGSGVQLTILVKKILNMIMPEKRTMAKSFAFIIEAHWI